MKTESSAAVIFAVLMAMLAPVAPAAGDSVYAQWSNGPSTDPNYFPIGVWLQQPSRAALYQAAGFNLYVGLWGGPTESQLSQLTAAGMPVICTQNSVGLAHVDDPIIVGWLQQDEPDNAQSDGSGGYNSPVPPFDDTPWNTNPPSVTSVYSRYTAMKVNDPTRPVYMNLGQGVGWDGWIGRGVRSNHPEDYPEYVQGTDIASFDIYPAASDRSINGELWRVADGVKRLVESSTQTQPVWNYIECTDIRESGKATPQQVKAEVWMSLVNGSMGITYFVHEIVPFNEIGLLSDPPMLAAVTAINNEVRSLAPVLNSPTAESDAVNVAANPATYIDMMVKEYDGMTYVFAVNMRDETTSVDFSSLPGDTGMAVDVIGEGRSLTLGGGGFSDQFDPWAVHLYSIAAISLTPGDANGDGAVDLQDFGILKANFGGSGGWAQGDFNDDGAVDLQDFGILKANFGTAAPSASIPEPATLILALLVAPAIIRRPRT